MYALRFVRTSGYATGYGLISSDSHVVAISKSYSSLGPLFKPKGAFYILDEIAKQDVYQRNVRAGNMDCCVHQHAVSAEVWDVRMVSNLSLTLIRMSYELILEHHILVV